ncbi:MAG: MMPL family transporter, partial [Microthrixaceae bacterium]
MSITVERTTRSAGESNGTEGWFARLARFSARRRRPVMVAWLVAVLAAAPLALGLSGALSGAGWEAQGSTAQRVRDELRADFPGLGAEAAVVVYHQRSQIADDPSGLHRLVADLQGVEGAARVVDPLAQPAEAGLVSPDGRTALIPVALAGADDAALPEAAGALIDHVEGVQLAPGATAE